MASINGTGYNIGTDIGISVTDDQGDQFPIDALGLLMDFNSMAASSMIKVVPITNGGKPLFQTTWVGGSGSMKFTRQTGNLQSMIAQLMDAYHSQGLIPQFSMAVSILNRDGSIDEYLFSGVQWETPHFGNFAALKEVDMSLEFVWSDCVLTGGASPFLPNLAA